MDLPRLHEIKHRYAHGQDRPIAGYLMLMATYATASAGLLLAGRHKAGAAQTRISGRDLALITIATHRISRTLAKDAVTTPLRAPLTRYRESGMPSEVNEEVSPHAQHHSGEHALAELLTCPFCLGQWVSTGLVAGQVLAPTLTRLVTSIFTATAGADALQFGYSALQRLDQPEE